MTRTAQPRLAALDVLRGLAVAGMILVVSPGDWAHAYAPLQHAAWDGWTIADMVFPTFLFGVGTALGLSFPRDWGGVARRSFRVRLARRVLALVALGVLVEATYVWAISAGAPYPGLGGLAHVRLPGILQRIGLCYGLAAVVAAATGRVGEGERLALRPAALGGAAAVLLAGYWLLVLLVPVPGVGSGHLDPAGNLGAYIDRSIFGVAHLWPLGWAVPDGPVVYDPEGLLTTLPATANVLLGMLAAVVVRRSPGRAAPLLLAGGLALFVLGLGANPAIPINKRLWTLSFALLSSGVSAMVLGALLLALRNTIAARSLAPLRALGGNAILAFLISTLFSRLSGFALLPENGAWIAPQAWGFHLAERIVPDPYGASLLCAVGIIALTMLAVWPLHRRAIHFRL